MFFKCTRLFDFLFEIALKSACRHDPRPNFHSPRTDLMLIRKQPNNVRRNCTTATAAMELWILFIPKENNDWSGAVKGINIQIYVWLVSFCCHVVFGQNGTLCQFLVYVELIWVNCTLIWLS